MKIQLTFDRKQYSADLSRPMDISIPVRSGAHNPNCYFSDEVKFEVIRSGDFVGSVREGGAVNHRKVHITPHGNGTHTECFGHIVDHPEGTINQSLQEFHFMAQLMTLTPRKISNGDQLIHFDDVMRLWQKKTDAIVIRTTPNEPDKLTRNYSGTNLQFS